MANILRGLPLVLTVLALTARAGEFVDRSLPAPADGTVEIVNTRGTVSIDGWDRSELRVAGELDDLAEALVFEVDNRHTLIEVKMPERNVNWGDGSNLEISVPAKSRVDFEGVSTDVTVRNVLGGLEIGSVSGDIDAGDLEERVILTTVSGNITLFNSTGTTRLNTVSGDMELDLTARDIFIDTVSGDLDLEMAAFSSLRANSVSGEIDIKGTLLDDGEVNLSSVSGDISLELEAPVNARLEARSGIGGDIVNHLSDDRPAENFLKSSLHATIGNGSGHIDLETVSGDILID